MIKTKVCSLYFIHLWTSLICGRTQGKKAPKTTKKRAADAIEVWAWDEAILPTLAVISKILRDLPTHRVYATTTERDTFIKCVIP